MEPVRSDWGSSGATTCKPVTGRLGFGCDDRRALAGRHAAANARIAISRRYTMADPVGRLYRLTESD